ncbi:MAG: Xaa-Pro aminopeptidase [Solirubrobacteraceae bacterium]|jgi:Xaa-Pro aminopeptidase|nr:Xaa-Pro aminopeptidase [Solirubrobacteraceae bacterium]
MSSARHDALAAAVAERELDALLVSNLVNVRWLTGFTGTNAVAVVGAQRRFVTDFRYLAQSAEQLDPEWEREIATDLLKRVVGGLPAGPLKLGFDDAHMSVKQHAQLAGLVAQDVELVAAGGVVEALRAVKDSAEIDAIRAAARLADEAFEEVTSAGIVGRTEKQVALDLEFAMRRRGADSASFPSIVAAGEHGAHPHARPRDIPIPAGTLVVIDWGAQLDGYASDCTRTVATGELDPRDRAVYDLVLRAQEEALAAVRPGPTGKEVDAVARAIIDGSGHAEHFGHGLGHGVGLEVHEGPRLSKQSDDALAAGNVVTVEPGVYVPGAVGVRIEDLVAVTAAGHEVLSSVSKELRVVQ